MNTELVFAEVLKSAMVEETNPNGSSLYFLLHIAPFPIHIFNYYVISDEAWNADYLRNRTLDIVTENAIQWRESDESDDEDEGIKEGVFISDIIAYSRYLCDLCEEVAFIVNLTTYSIHNICCKK